MAGVWIFRTDSGRPADWFEARISEKESAGLLESVGDQRALSFKIAIPPIPSGNDAWPWGRSGDGTPAGFVIRDRGGVRAQVPGERSLSLCTPGLHDESPLGFGVMRRAVSPAFAQLRRVPREVFELKATRVSPPYLERHS